MDCGYGSGIGCVLEPLFRILDLLSRKGSADRKELAEEAGIEPSALEGVLGVFRSCGWIRPVDANLCLTDVGRKGFSDLGLKYVDFSSSVYVVGDCQQGVLVEGAADKFLDPAQVRDMASTIGSQGASLFVMKGGRLRFPPMWDLDEMDPGFASMVRGTGIKEGDVLAVVGSQDQEVSRSVAATLGLAMKQLTIAGAEPFDLEEMSIRSRCQGS
ncbi:MAG: hypothetical protein IJ856_01360 [Candidatus Methanomethylophilaceae archaeon]|nr:hypothetical protein [Candidatus Methanomethylophilaceae archaeon]